MVGWELRPAGGLCRVLGFTNTTGLAALPHPADFSVAAKRTFHLAGFAFLHDFAVTPNYYVVFQNPVTGA